jgi:hypothetical protein
MGMKRALEEMLCLTSEWARCAFPEVQLTEQLAASMMCSGVPAEVLPDDLDTPWPCFVIRFPAETLRNYSTVGAQWPDPVYYESAFVLRMPGYWMIKVISPKQLGGDISYKLHTLPELTQDLGDYMVNYSDDTDLQGDYMVRDPARRASHLQSTVGTLAGRLILGTILELSGREHRKKIQKNKNQGGLRRASARQQGEPTAWVYELRRPVVLDCRERVREIVAGSHRPVTVQTFVRGHWKMQACGIGSLHRKHVHIEPYWRGPEEAPIVVRPRVIAQTD